MVSIRRELIELRDQHLLAGGNPGLVRMSAEIARARVADALDHLELIQVLIRRDDGPEVSTVGDADGLDLRPDPLSARTDDELLDVLRRYRRWAGEPSYRVMSARNGGIPAAATICTVLTGHRPPKLDMVLAIVAGCGGGDEDQRRFASAWRAIRAGTAARGYGEPPPENPVQAGRVILQQVIGRQAAG